jgi:(p)ppGpp synthase/HD superfamily hydrolase
MTILTERFTEAVDYVRVAHASQFRKGSSIPYIYHLLGVASLVIEHGGSENQAIAGLLHDVIEDCGESHRAIVRERFGDEVGRIVDDCTDGSAEDKAKPADLEARREDWRQRKLKYLAHLADAHHTTLLVSGCDKLHNARAVLIDLENPEVGQAVFERFTAGREGTLRYYQSLSEIFSTRKTPMAAQLESVVARMHALANADERVGLVVS